jgi:hypothetical protein
MRRRAKIGFILTELDIALTFYEIAPLVPQAEQEISRRLRPLRPFLP